MRRNLLGEVYRDRRRVFKIIFHYQRVKNVDRSFYGFGRDPAEDLTKGGEFLDQLVD
jgi:hypothetical protein